MQLIGHAAANINAETGIAYGYISANALDPEVVERLMNGSWAIDHTYDAALAEIEEEALIAAAENGINEFDYEDWTEAYVDERMEEYTCDEPEISGTYEGVSYRTSWLGGALNFFIFDSPVTTDKARRASPCVPNAGILDTLDGSETSYDVPADWRAER